MPGLALIDPLIAPCSRDPQARAIIDAGGKKLSREQLIQKVRVLSRGFTESGLQPGQRVLFAVRPDAESILLMIAIAEAGGVLVPLDPSMGPVLFRSRMDMLAPAWVVAESVLYAATANRWIMQLLGKLGLRLPRLAEIKNARFVHVGPALPGVPKGLSTAQIERLGEKSVTAMRIPAADEAAIIVFTSGTTGSPKAVVHSRRSMRGVLDIIGPLLEAGDGDVIFARELHVILPALYAGAAVVIPRRSGFSVKRLLRHLQKFEVTHFFGVTSELQKTVDYLHFRHSKLPPSLRQVWIGAAPVRAAFLQDFQTVLAHDTQAWCVYGMTEILPVARVSLDEKINYPGAGDLLGACVPGVSAAISEDGELVLCGPNLFSGYYGETPCEEHHTGDLARLDEGRIVLLGRRKDMIIRGRFNIYPELYESTIERIPGVRRCAMVGIYDDTVQDERVMLAIEPDQGVDGLELQKRVSAELRRGSFSIDSAALPDDIMIMRLPMTGRSGKIDKQSLRAHAHRTKP